jgi:hypothetical protein
MSANFIIPDWPAPTGVKSIVTTRLGGFSHESYASLNPALHVGDNPEHVARNRALISQQLATRFSPQWLEQVHGVTVFEANARDLVYPESGRSEVAGNACVPSADAVITGDRGLPCAIMTADCLPVLFCNTSGDRVAAAHAGWRGLLAGVLENTCGYFEQSPEHLMAWFGPAIGPGNFEVGGEVRDAFIDYSQKTATAFVANKDNPGHWFADLYALATIRLNSVGLRAIYGGGFCTYRDSERFYSYRRDRVTGRMASLIWLE